MRLTFFKNIVVILACGLCACSKSNSDSDATSWAQPSAVLSAPTRTKPLQLTINGIAYSPIFFSLNMQAIQSDSEWTTFLYQLDLALARNIVVLDLALANQSIGALQTLNTKLGSRQVYLWLRFDLWDQAGIGQANSSLQNRAGASIVDNRIAYVLKSNGQYTSIPLNPPLTNSWIQAQQTQMQTFLQNVNTYLPGRVIGLRPTYMETGEWFRLPATSQNNVIASPYEPDQLPLHPDNYYFDEYLTAIQNEFCNWELLPATLKGASCHMPSTQGRISTSDGSYNAQAAPYLNRYLALQVTKAQTQIAATIKQYTNRQALVAVNAGYIYTLANYQGSSHIALRELLDSTDIDAIAAPYNYEGTRAPGTPFLPHGPMDSPLVHGKIWLNEDDTRTSFAASDSLQSTTDITGDIGFLRRNAMTSGLHGNALYYFDLLNAGWFGKSSRATDSAALWNSIQASQKTLNLLKPNPSATTNIQAEIAVFIDDRSFAYSPLTGLDGTNSYNFANTLVVGNLLELEKIGAPIRHYLLSDLLSSTIDLSHIKMAILVNPFALDTDLKNAVTNKLLNSNRFVIVQQTPGSSQQIFGTSQSQYTLLYTSPINDAANYLRYAQKYGVKIYGSVMGDAVEAQGNTLMIHAGASGNHGISLAQADYVEEDAASDQTTTIVCTSCSSFSFSMQKGETRVFRIGH